MGSKARIAKHILPIMIGEARKRSITKWVEPFVGGGNVIDKVPASFERVGIDLNPHAIQALIAVRDFSSTLPDEVTVDYYKSILGTSPSPITSLIRFGSSFGGKFENGYARRDGKSMWGEAVRNAIKQSSGLAGVELIIDSYDKYSHLSDCVIYCDPPYEGTTSYSIGVFDHYKFWDWCRRMSEKNLVFISEYKAPDDFICVWEGGVKTNFASQRQNATHSAVERLFVFNKTITENA